MDRFRRGKIRFKNDLFASEEKVPSPFSHVSLPFYNIKKEPQYPKDKENLGLPVKFENQEEDEASKKKVFDPDSRIAQQWNKVFLLSCLVALFVDPFFFFLPEIGDNGRCIRIEQSLAIVVTVLRTITDAFYLLHIALQFRTGFVASSTRVFGKGVLVVDLKLIAKRYLSGPFWLDLVAVLPIPQMAIWLIRSLSRVTPAYFIKNALRFIIICQFFPRLYLVFKLIQKIVKSTGVVTRTAWAGAVYNLALYVLASHLIGASWYFLAIERIDTCWRQQCRKEGPSVCNLSYLYCNGDVEARLRWSNSTNAFAACKDPNQFNLGIYQKISDKGIGSTQFVQKYLFCLWFGLQQLSSLGQNLETSLFVWEILFCIIVAIIGLVLFALLIGNMQAYLQSLGVRAEKWRVKQSDTEEWMQHRQLPEKLRQRVREYNRYRWIATRGVDEESLLKSLPADLHRDIKRHLCLELVKKVPLFKDMEDARVLDAVCVRLKPVLRTTGSVIVREGDAVGEMLFVIRGRLDSVTTNGGRTGFFNQAKLGPGSFCGEELLTWVLGPEERGLAQLPASTRTIAAESEVEAFVLSSDDVRHVARRFQRLHRHDLTHRFRVHSLQWQTWAACVIQAAWKRFQARRSLGLDASASASASAFAFASASASDSASDSAGASVPIKRPEEPDFGADAPAEPLPPLIDI